MAIHQTHTSPPKLLELTFPDAGIGNKVVMKLRVPARERACEL